MDPPARVLGSLPPPAGSGSVFLGSRGPHHRQQFPPGSSEGARAEIQPTHTDRHAPTQGSANAHAQACARSLHV